MYYQMQSKHTKGKKTFLLSPFPDNLYHTQGGKNNFLQKLVNFVIGAADWKN